MRINSYSSTHNGTQPIRVLQHNIITQFEGTNPSFLELLKEVSEEKKLKPDIGYYINQHEILHKVDNHKQTPFVDENKKIYIHETFLSYVWGISYSLLVLYEEDIAKESQNQISKKIIFEIDRKKIAKAYELFNYSKSLITDYTEWDKLNLPNPEDYSNEDKFFVEKANSLFIYAINFILCHEFAHVELDHHNLIKNGNYEPSLILRLEKEADERAFDLILADVSGEFKLTAEIGVLMGLCSLLFFSKFSKEGTHPAPDDRINTLITRLNTSHASAHWGIGVVAFKLWDNQFQQNFDWPNEVNSIKDLYDLIRKEIKKQN